MQEKRILQQELYDATVSQSRKDLVKEKLNDYSDKIGKVIEESKKVSQEMQDLHAKSQVEHNNMKDAQDELYHLKGESDSVISGIQRKVSLLDNELSGLRRKIADIQKKLT